MLRSLALLGCLTAHTVLAGDITPFQAQEVQPAPRAEEPRVFQADDVEPVRPAAEPRVFQAEDVKPAGLAEEPRPFQAETPSATRAAEPRPAAGSSVERSRSSSDIEPFQADAVKHAPRPGVDPVAHARPIPRELAGSWKLFVPSSSTTHRLHDGPSVIDRTTSTAGAVMGTLRISADGRFTFTRAGVQVASGRVDEVRPRVGADANGRYFRVRDEREEFYVNVTAGRLTLYSVAGNSFVANGTR